METMENHGMDAEFNFESALEDYLSTDFGDLEEGAIVTVSYTHLTLPTNSRV